MEGIYRRIGNVVDSRRLGFAVIYATMLEKRHRTTQLEGIHVFLVYQPMQLG